MNESIAVQDADVQGVLKRFEVDPRFEKSLRTPEDRLLFYRLAVAVHERGLDWWATKMINSGSIRFGRKNSLKGDGTAVLMSLNPLESGMEIKFNKLFKDDSWRPLDESAIAEIEDPQFAADFLQIHPLINREARWPDEYRVEDSDSLEDELESDVVETNIQPKIAPPLNQILYGPPGTGKTYATIDAALEIIDPAFLASHHEREELKQRFDELSTEGRIRFVTFHQSFSYEDFVEGIRALPPSEEDEQGSGNIQYQIEKGIFGRLCEDAQRNKVYEEQIGVRENAKVWKISIEEANSSGETRQYCFKHGEARIGWPDVKDIRETNLADPALKLGTNAQSSLANFGRDIVPGDVLVCLGTTSQICAVGVVTGEYKYTPQVPEGVRKDYVHKLPVKWLATNLKFNIMELNQGTELTIKTVYLLWRIKWPALQEALHRANIVLADEVKAPAAQSTEPYVLIIDEINRGNISRVFGELITLIEPSKRANAEEALSTLLPYSKQPFSIPNNVYLIGTMNTADRSLAGLDIALRRRFTFKEMPPKPELFHRINIEGVSIEMLLKTMNERIEVLLDRDHCLGHAYFISLKTNDSLKELALIFQQKIMPLLQEYFFEDWERIGWVLNDHNKSREQQFIQKVSSNIESLFGNNFEGNLQDRRWRINDAAFDNIESYRGILGGNV